LWRSRLIVKWLVPDIHLFNLTRSSASSAAVSAHRPRGRDDWRRLPIEGFCRHLRGAGRQHRQAFGIPGLENNARADHFLARMPLLGNLKLSLFKLAAQVAQVRSQNHDN
jgi:hypothetical protein